MKLRHQRHFARRANKGPNAAAMRIAGNRAVDTPECRVGFPGNSEGNARCTLMFPVSVCLRIESKRFVEEETQRKRLQDGSVDRMEEATADEGYWAIIQNAFSVTQV